MVVETILNTRPTAREKVWAGEGDFIAVLDAVPGWSEWRKHKITYTLDFDGSLETGKRGDPLNEFSFSNEIERQHAVVMGFLTLADGVASLKECEFYFRRYPFNNLPVSRQRHMTNICEMYFLVDSTSLESGFATFWMREILSFIRQSWRLGNF